MKLQTLFISLALCLCIGGGKLYAQATYYISSRTELKAFADRVNDETKEPFTGTAYLTADIDLKNEAWTPIGTFSNPFQGYFEGWGHKISRLSVTGSDDYAGLFGYIDGGYVQDVGIESGDISGGISGGRYVGGICGYLKSGEISSCYSNVTVSGTQCVGGICGKSEGVIENCWHTGDITATETNDVYVGGLVGEASGTLQRCYVANTTIDIGNYSGKAYFGEIAGDWYGNTDKLNCCIFNTGDVTIPGYLGGDVIVGSQDGGSSPTSFTNVTGAENDEMQSVGEANKNFWNGILNTETNNLVWVITQGSYPELNSFCKNAPITFHFTPTKKWLSIVPNGNYTDLKGIKAYKVIEADKSQNIITLKRVNTLNEGCGALVYFETTEEGGVDITLTHDTDEGLDDYSGNYLKGSHVSPPTFNGDGTEYILSSGVFVPAVSGSLARNKAYLKVPVSAASAPRFDFQVMDDEEVTKICDVTTDNGQQTTDRWYTLSGVKLTGAPTEKGVYIHNGRKEAVR